MLESRVCSYYRLGEQSLSLSAWDEKQNFDALVVHSMVSLREVASEEKPLHCC